MGEISRKPYEGRSNSEVRASGRYRGRAAMTSFTPLKPADDSVVEFEPQPPAPANRPSRWSLTNWPVRWKVFAIVLVPLILAATFGGMRIYVGAVSEIMPLRTEALVTQQSVGVDGLEATPLKRTTTVAMDFGRITLDEDLVLYLFGTPGQRRFWFMWDDLVRGAIGAIILVDVRRLQDSFAAVDFFEARNLPFLIAINEFDGAPRHPAHEVRRALALAGGHPGDHRRRP